MFNSKSTLLVHLIAQVCSKVGEGTWTVGNTLNKHASMACLTRGHASAQNPRNSLQKTNTFLELAQPNSPLPHHHIPAHNSTEAPFFTGVHAENQNPRGHAEVHQKRDQLDKRTHGHQNHRALKQNTKKETKGKGKNIHPIKTNLEIST